MRAVIIHLIDVHGYRRLAIYPWAREPLLRPGTLSRYLDVLQEYGLSFDPQLVTPRWIGEAGAQAVQTLLDERHLHPQS